ncbi:MULTISPECIES: monovalent cation/H(+) antiporter subunit G [unclassified Thioalkalivibrio]|uniref:monovalent cation/H(+) antiporter subunit G n=1 Tax=unclassified Thioalkalivibrio TaxID=2621013 RepID=UPI000364FACC|nr:MULTISPECIES: monovalent cation/H(+) antiporter subunit G [unclassified Thioalkalivibrio]PYG01295.1 multisubunit sodium/proton antiporter MrpG subunit [Thioalkalivibrio sp. ALE21]
MIADLLTAVLVLAGLVFFAAGTLGLLRFPDVYTRLHALTKADNLGLGLVVLGLMLQADGPAMILKLALIWVLVLAAGATAAHMVAQRTWTHGEFERRE